MSNALRYLSAAALVVALSPLTSAQGVDCDNIPLSMGAPDPAYAVCAQPYAVAPPAEDPNNTSFGHNAAASAFVRFQHSTPGTLNTVGAYTPPGGGFLNGGDFDGNDLSTWYGVDNLGQAFTVNTSTGAVTQLGIMGTGWSGVTYDFTTDKFYGLQVLACGSGSQLFELNFSTLTATPIGGIDVQNGCGIGLAAHPTTGVLYSYDLSLDQALTINKTTGASTVLGPIGFDANFGQGMDFDNEDNTLYLYAFNNLTFVAELRTMDLATGNTTLIGTLGAGLQQLGTASTETEGGGTPSCEQSITATLDDPTPSPGQTITFAVTVSNDAASAATLDLWIDASGPANLRKRLARGTLPAGATVTRNVRVRVPGNAPSGAYAVDLNIGDFGSDDICDTASFTVTVSAPRMGAGASDTEWEATVEGDFFAAASATTAGAGVAVAPNPFARQTTISYEVAAASDVRLAVYDVLGREVAVLVDARQEAGAHRATFDASGLAAGTYVYRLVVGSDVQTGRLTLAN